MIWIFGAVCLVVIELWSISGKLTDISRDVARMAQTQDNIYKGL
jgi:hypothetical protein